MRRLTSFAHKPGMAELSIFLITSSIYLSTLAPGVYGFDSAELVTGIFTQGIVHPPGFPLYLLVGKFFSLLPVDSLSYKLNLMSAFFAAVTAVLLYRSMLFIIKDAFASWAAALIFSASFFFWQMALVAEVYTFYTAFLAIDFLFLGLWLNNGKKKHLVLFSIFFGLTLATHTSGILFAPGFAWLILRSPRWESRSWKHVPAMLAGFVTGLSPYLYLMYRAGQEPLLNYTILYPEVDLTRLSGLWWYVSGQAYHMFAWGYSLQEVPAEVLWFFSSLWRNFLGVGLIVGIIGAVLLFRRSKSLALGLGIMICFQAAFFINYRVSDKDTMLLPAYLIWSFLIASGIAELRRFMRSQFTNEAAVRNFTLAATNSLWITVIALQVILNLQWVDLRGATGYAEFGNATMAVAEPNAVVFAPWSTAVVLEYFQIVEGYRPDLVIVNQSRQEVAWYYELNSMHFEYQEILAEIEARATLQLVAVSQRYPVYIVDFEPRFLDLFSFVPAGPLFKLMPR